MTRRNRKPGPAPARPDSTAAKLRTMIAEQHRALCELEARDALSPRARAERHSRLWALRAQLALATNAGIEAAEASAEALKWEQRAAAAPADDCPVCAAAAASIDDPIKIVREAYAALSIAGLLDALPPPVVAPPPSTGIDIATAIAAVAVEADDVEA